jgi:hypothetical protein
MAVSFGDVLSGIGASLQGTGQEYMQNLNTREVNSANRDIAMQDRTMALQDRAKAQQGALVKAVQQDANAALQALDHGDVQGALAIAHDHMVHAQGIPGYDPTRAMHILVLLTQGDPASVAAAHAELLAASGSSYSRPEPMKLGSGDVAIDPTTGKQLFNNPAKPPAEAAGIQELKWKAAQLGLKDGTPEYRAFIQSNGSMPSSDNRKTSVDQNGVLRYTDNGTPVFPNVSKTEIPKVPTEEQGKVATFAARSKQANDTIDKLGPQFVGAFSAAGQFLPNAMKSADRQLIEQSNRNFINATLRRESGAAISPSEFDSANAQYLPQPFDKPAVLAEKSKNRQLVLAGLIAEAPEQYQKVMEQYTKSIPAKSRFSNVQEVKQ